MGRVPPIDLAVGQPRRYAQPVPDAPTEDSPGGPVADPRPLWRQLVPIALACTLVGWVLSRVDWQAFTAQLAIVSYPAFGGLIALFLASLLAVDTLATVHVYRRTVPDLSFRKLLIVRAASYLPSLLNHHVGQAWVTWFVSRTYKVELRRMAGATLLVYATWAGCLLLLAVAAFIANGMSITWVLLLLGSGLAYLILLAINPNVLARNRVLAPLFEAGVRGHLSAMAYRLPHVVVLFVGTWAPFLFFGVDIPLTDALTYIPMLMVVVTLPLTPLGVGTRDALAAELLARFVDAPTEAERLAAVAASTTTTAVALVVLEAALGLLFLRRASRLLEGR